MAFRPESLLVLQKKVKLNPLTPQLRMPLLRRVDVTPRPEFSLPKVLQLHPLYTTHFIRSPFFFHSFLIPKRVKYADLLQVDYDVVPSTHYLVFPDVNDAKVAVFRRLNKQKLLAQARFFAHRSLYPADPADSTALRPLPKITTRVPSPYPVKSSPALNWSDKTRIHNVFAAPIVSERSHVRIRRIRFKPGYGRI